MNEKTNKSGQEQSRPLLFCFPYNSKLLGIIQNCFLVLKPYFYIESDTKVLITSWFFKQEKQQYKKLYCCFLLLSHKDSNLVRQNQKLQCYHYTMRQSLGFISKAVQRYDFFLSPKTFFGKLFRNSRNELIRQSTNSNFSCLSAPINICR